MVEVVCGVCGDIHDHMHPCDASPSEMIPVDEAWERTKEAVDDDATEREQNRQRLEQLIDTFEGSPNEYQGGGVGMSGAADPDDVDVDEMVEELLENAKVEPPEWMTGMSIEHMEPEKVEMTFDPEEQAAYTGSFAGTVPTHTHTFKQAARAGKSQQKSGAALAQKLTSPIERAAKRLAEEDDEPEEVGRCPMCGAGVTDDNDDRVETSAGGVYCDVDCYNDLVGP